MNFTAHTLWDGFSVLFGLGMVAVAIFKLHEMGKQSYPDRPAWFQILAPLGGIVCVVAVVVLVSYLLGNAVEALRGQR